MTKQQQHFPVSYYLALFLIFLLMILFWVLVLRNTNNGIQSNTSNLTEVEYWQQDYLPKVIGETNPIDTSKIIIDSVSNRKIINNIVNIALKQNNGSIAKLAHTIKQNYTSNNYKIVYIDSVINRLQVELPEKDREIFKMEIKNKFPEFKLLVWDETLFSFNKSYNDPYLSNPKTSWYFNAINIQKAWEETTGNKDIVVAVIDNGFDLKHPELKGKITKAYNVISKNNNVSPSNQNHGTHVASTIVANGNNKQGLVGICPECSLMPIKVEDENGFLSNSYIIDAILYAIKNKADVINLSLGMQIPLGINIPLDEQKKLINSTAKDEEEFWNDLFAYATENNTICVLAAGNSNISTGIDPFQRSNNTIKVGAFAIDNQKAVFSNYGNLTTIYAPGTEIIGAKPNNSYEQLEGTSMAAPIVTGIVALLKSKNKNTTLSEVKMYLVANSKLKNNINQLYINSF